MIKFCIGVIDMRYVYPAIFVKDEDDSYKVLFPDLDISTDGKIMEEAF